MWTLVLNCGSSSVKFALLRPGPGEVALSGMAERLGSEGAALRLDRDGERRNLSQSDTGGIDTCESRTKVGCDNE